jgi:hypothetical protein
MGIRNHRQASQRQVLRRELGTEGVKLDKNGQNFDKMETNL